jgi:hypothetical protein
MLSYFLPSLSSLFTALLILLLKRIGVELSCRYIYEYIISIKHFNFDNCNNIHVIFYLFDCFLFSLFHLFIFVASYLMHFAVLYLWLDFGCCVRKMLMKNRISGISNNNNNNNLEVNK